MIITSLQIAKTTIVCLQGTIESRPNLNRGAVLAKDLEGGGLKDSLFGPGDGVEVFGPKKGGAVYKHGNALSPNNFVFEFGFDAETDMASAWFVSEYTHPNLGTKRIAIKWHFHNGYSAYAVSTKQRYDDSLKARRLGVGELKILPRRRGTGEKRRQSVILFSS